MKGIKKGLAILLVLCTLLSLVFVAGAAPMPQSADADQVQATAASSEDGYKYSIVMVDCGRKYFSVSSLKSIIDSAASAGMNYVMLGIGNDGLRFLLDDMSLTVDGNKYESKAVSDAIHAGNEAYSNFAVDELSERDMNNIVAYACEKGVGIIPLINTPGHMDAILDCIESCTGDNTVSFDNSARTIDVTNSKATAFTKALLQKYINYFAGKGCKLFNMGCDEYANDIYPSGSMGFGQLQREGNYDKFVTYVNEVAAMVEEAGMIPMAFNDGIYFNNDTNSGTFNTGILVCYWSPGWNSYSVASASFLKGKGFNLINTNGSYYWIVGGNKCTADKASQFDVHTFPALNDTTVNIDNPVGAMFCIWSDTPQAEEDTSVATNVAPVISAFGEKLPATTAGGDTGNTDDKEEPITVSVGGTDTRTIPGVNLAGTYPTEDPSIATVVVTGTPGVPATTTYTRDDNVKCNALISNTTDKWTAVPGYYYTLDGTNYYPVYAKYSTSGSIFVDHEFTWGFSRTDSSTNVENIKTQTVNWYDSWPTVNIEVYTQSTTEEVKPSTTITFTGVAEGTTSVIIGNTKYNITVIPEDLNAVAPLTVEYWITNSRLTASDDANSVTINAADKDVHSETGVNIADLAASTASKDNRTQEYWQAKILDTAKANSSTSGTEKQTGDSGDDETLSGAAFTKVRYWGGKWQVFTTDWVNVEKQHQLVAYYMEVININNANGESELHANAADWGTKGDGSGDWGYSPESSRCSVSVQIVYEDATTNPADTTANALKTKTIVYAYWNGGRGLGTMIFNGQENYEIYKVTAETGDMTSSTNGRYVTVTGFTWDRNEETVWEGDATQSVSIGNPTRKPNYEAPYDNLAWDTSSHNKNNAILIRVYVKAVATEDSLTVHYIDKTANIEFYDYNITVASGTIFDEGFALSNGKLVNNTVINTNGVTQTVQSDLSTMPEIAAQYRGRDYTCAEVKRNDDGKDVYLYYTFNDVKSFVIDFGLPVNITMEKLGIDSSAWTSATVSNAKYGNATASIQDGVTYTPTQTLKGAEALTVTLANESESITQQIYIYPATTVYYEEGFATYSGTVTDGTNKGDVTQTASAAGSNAHYGYDAAYLNNTQDSNGTVATLNAGEQGTFTFTGTGVDVYACTKTDSGKVMIYVYSGSGDDKTLTRLITVDTRQFGEQSAEDTAYNVPIVSLSGLDYGEYTLVMKEVQTKTDIGKVNYPVYIDGFRVHGTLDVVNTQVYKDDNEANPTFVELRNSVLNAVIGNTDPDSIYADQIANKTMSQVYAAKEEGVSALIVTKDTSSALEGVVVKDLLDNGPKNEIYLKQNESLVFTANATSAQIGLKALNGATTYTINNGAQVDLITSTDMFYSISTDTVVITNTGSGILSITELKLFGAGTSTASVEPMSAPALTRALKSLGFEAEPVAATATLNITVQCGDKAVPVTLTADGMSGDTHTFTAAEIKAAVEQALPEGYNVDDVTFSDVTVACGESTDVSFAAAQTQTPDAPTSIIGKIVSIAKKIIHKIISWF